MKSLSGKVLAKSDESVAMACCPHPGYFRVQQESGYASLTTNMPGLLMVKKVPVGGGGVVQTLFGQRPNRGLLFFNGASLDGLTGVGARDAYASENTL